MKRSWRVLVALAVILLTATVGGPVVASAAQTPDETGPLSASVPVATPARDRALITLTSVDPVVVGPGKTVKVKGVVTAPAVGALLGATMRVIEGTAALDRRGEVADWAAQTGPARGRVVATTRLPTVNAGQSTTFTLDFPASRVARSAPFAAIPISVEVTAQDAPQPSGVLRTFLNWQSRKEYVPLEIATVLPVTLDPDPDLFSGHEDARVAAWRSAIGPGSRVQHLIDGSAGHTVTLAVDPSVFGPALPGGASPDSGPPEPSPSPSPTASGPATGAPTVPSGTPPSPTPGTPGGTATPTPHQSSSGAATTTPAGVAALAGPEVAQLGDDVVAELRGRSVWALPYADADLAAAASIDPTNGMIRDLVDRSSIVGERLGAPARADIVMPADGLLAPGTEAALTTLLRGTRVGKPAGIVVNSATITSPTAYTPSARRISASGTRLLAWDPTLSGLLPIGAASGVAPRQQFLAETLALLGERPGTERSVLVLGGRTYRPDPATLRDLLAAIDAAPWLTPVPADSLLVDSGSDVATRASTPTRSVPAIAPAPTLTAARLARMAEQRDTLRRVATVLRDGAAFEATYREVLDELASARWRWNPRAWPLLESSVSANVHAATSAIKVVPRSFNFLAEQGTLSITVENGLDFAVEDIRLVLSPTNPRMQVVQQPPPIRIGANSKTSVKVTVRAVAAGQADIRAFLTTADGTPIGSPAVIPVAANPLDSTIYWVGGVLAALVLVAGVARALLRGTARIDEIDDAQLLDVDPDVDPDVDRDADARGEERGPTDSST